MKEIIQVLASFVGVINIINYFTRLWLGLMGMYENFKIWHIE